MNDSCGETQLVALCPVDAVEPGAALRVEVEGLPPLAVFHVADGFHVCNDTCSHGNASLSEGTIEDGAVECPWHSGSFCLRTGNALSFPAVTPIRVYPVTVVDGMVCVASPGGEA